jgi:hypothetical protein
MAIVKASYTRVRSKIKANLRYITHRPGRDKEKITRQLFGWDGDLTKDKAYRMIDEAEKGTIGFRIVLNFDPKKENPNKTLDLRDLTKQFMLNLWELKNKQAFEFFAVEHNDHTDLPHIHAVVLFHGKIFKKDLVSLRRSLGQEVHAQYVGRWQMQRSIERLSTSYQPSIGMAGGRARRARKAREPTPPCPQGGMHAMVKLADGKYWCPVHKKVHEQSQGLSL